MVCNHVLRRGNKLHIENSTISGQVTETIEIGSWELAKQVEWRKTRDIADEEEAVDALASTWETKAQYNQFRYLEKHNLLQKDCFQRRPNEAIILDALAAGSASKTHRAALLYVAGEYERVSALAATSDVQVAKRAAEKAVKLRELANQ